MHTVLIAVSLALAGLGSLGCTALLRVAHSWDSRRTVQLAGLLLPVVVLIFLATGLVHFVSQICFQSAPWADVTLTSGLIGIGIFGLLGATLLNSLRLILLPWHFRQRTWLAPGWLQAQVRGQAAELGCPRAPQVRVAADARPWAYVARVARPVLVVSSGLVGLLDPQELDAVLCHELLHLRRGDVWWTALAGVFRDLTWFLPVTRHLYATLRAEQELACDDQVLGEPRRLALASALARVWQAGMSHTPAPRGALALLAAPRADFPEARLRRLVDRPGGAARPSARRAWLVVTVVLGLVVLTQLGVTLWTMSTLHCDLTQVWTMGLMH